MAKKYILSIAGFDPSGGAGVIADCKVFNSFGFLGLAASTSITYQNEEHFLDVKWLNFKTIKKQLDPLFDLYEIDFVKIGLVKNLSLLKKIIKYLKEKNSSIFILWDPILITSSGFVIHKKIDEKKFVFCLKSISMLTPNWKEAQVLNNNDDAIDSAKNLTRYTNIYLKGGHNNRSKGTDYLFIDNQMIAIASLQISKFEKHGSGCVFSSAFLAHIALGFDYLESAKLAKSYIEKYLDSDVSKLGLHDK
jgi:hydroxymethylpyrimidine/phosphomethylpyrimidine kinase